VDKQSESVDQGCPYRKVKPTGVPLEIRELVRGMSLANPLWGAPRIHGELLKLGIDVGQTSVAKYMAKHRRSPSPGWRTFVRNHADGIASIDLFVVPTFSFRLLYGLLIPRHDRRQILCLDVTTHPTVPIFLAERAHGMTDRFNPTGVSRPRRRLQ
jgi:hypothetical protein